MRNYSIFTWFGYKIPMTERAKLIKEAGFDMVMLWWSDEHRSVDGKKEDHPALFNKLGIKIENIHMPLKHANDLWFDNLAGEEVLKTYKSCLADCYRFDFPVAVMHLTRGNEPSPVNSIGINRIKHLVEEAAKTNTVIALENLTRWDYLEPVFNEIDSPFLGFCYDSGHAFLNSETPYALIGKYSDKLKSLHLHDNMGDEDSHRLPIEGLLNWHALIDAVISSGYQGPLSLEVSNPKSSESPSDYLGRAFDTAVVLEKLRNYEY